MNAKELHEHLLKLARDRAEEERAMTMTPAQLRVADRITAYLSGGGLFNPELANHDAVRDLLIDARDELHMLRLHIADKNATITAMGATHEKLAARVRELQERAEKAERRAERLKGHADRMRQILTIGDGGFPCLAVADYDAEFKGE